MNNEGTRVVFMRVIEEACLPSGANIGADNLSEDDSSNDNTSAHYSMPSLIGRPGCPHTNNISSGSFTLDPTVWSGCNDDEDKCPVRGLVRILDEHIPLLGRVNQEGGFS